MHVLEHETSVPRLSPDQLDDLIYFTRTGDRAELKAAIEICAISTQQSAHDVVLEAIDLDLSDPASSSGCSLLHWAAANGHIDVLRHLVELISTNYDYDSSKPPSSVYVPPSTTAPIKAHAGGLINHQNISGNTALHWAALNTHLECVKILVYHGADPRIRNKAGQDAVFEAERGEANLKGGASEENNEAETEQKEKHGTEVTESTKEVGVVEWLLDNCEGLDKGVGGSDSEQTPAADGLNGDTAEQQDTMDVDN